MNDDSMHPIAVLFLIVLMVVALPFALIGLVIYGIYKLNKNLDESDAKTAHENRVADAVAARPKSSRKELGPDSCLIELAPDGTQIFTPFVTEPDRAYRLRITGTVRFGETVTDAGVAYDTTMDPLFTKDENGNFVLANNRWSKGHGLKIDGKPLDKMTHELALGDRETHAYEIIIDGTGNKLAFAFDYSWPYYHGRFTINVARCDGTVLTFAARAALAAERRAAEELAEAVEAVAINSELDRNWSDPAFVDASAKTRAGEILASRPDLQRRLGKLHENKTLMAHLRAHEPELLRRLTGPIEAFLIAQRMAVTSAVLKPKRRKTQEEVRAYLVRGAEMVAEDERAMLDAGAAAYERKAQTLRDRGLDEDEITNVLGSLAEALQEIKERVAARKGAADVAIAKVG
jgi:PAS domain-containing protein